MTFTAQEKLDAVRREISYRRRVYGRRVQLQQMSKELADRQIALFEAIEADYQESAKMERLL